MTCGRGTARQVARAAVRERLARPRLVLLLVAVTVLAGTPLAVAGDPLGGLVQALLSIVFIAGVVVAAAYRQALKSAAVLYPAGAPFTVELGADALLLRTATGEQECPYFDLYTPRRVSGHLLVPLRSVAAYLTVPAGLLEPRDVEWLADRIARATASDAAGTARAPQSAPADVHAAWPHEVVLTDEVMSEVTRAVVRYRLVSRASLVRAVVAATFWLWLGVVTGRWLLAAGPVGTVALVAIVAVVVSTRRALRRTGEAQGTLRARFDDTQVHLDGALSRASFAYTSLRRCVVIGGAVLLVSGTGMLQVLPRELVPDDALARLRDATGAGSAR